MPVEQADHRPAGTFASAKRARRGRRLRRIGVAAFAAVMALALAGLLGPREVTATAHGVDGTELSVTYPSVVRPGLEVDVKISASASPAREETTLAFDQTLAEELGIERISPEPKEQHAAGNRVFMVFTHHGDDPINVILEGRVPTQARIGRHAVAVDLIEPEERARPAAAHVDLKVWVLP